VTIDQLRHAVRSGGKMSEQRVPFKVRDEARDGLADWWSERIDRWFFNQITGNTAQADTRYTGMQAATAPDSGHQVFANIGPAVTSAIAATAEASLSATTVARFHLGIIDRAVEKGKLAVNYLRPMRVGSKDLLVAFLHPYQVTSLRQSLSGSTQWSDIQKAAMQGGDIDGKPDLHWRLGHVQQRGPARVGACATGGWRDPRQRSMLLARCSAALRQPAWPSGAATARTRSRGKRSCSTTRTSWVSERAASAAWSRHGSTDRTSRLSRCPAYEVAS
jgi:hypothetical protein